MQVFMLALLVLKFVSIAHILVSGCMDYVEDTKGVQHCEQDIQAT